MSTAESTLAGLLQLRGNFMQRIWAPWRLEYIKAYQKDMVTCVFCAALEKPDGAENLVIFRGESAFVILNRFPYTSGHLMVLPNVHTDRLEKLDMETRTEIMELVNQSTQILGEVYKPEGFNLGANLGAAAGAGIEAHVHLHVVPRWVGDTNFMSTVGETRVLPEAVEASWDAIKKAWSKY
jgi:ATP adenylyltransferase